MTRKRRVTITGTTGQLGGALIQAQSDIWEIDELNRRDVHLTDWNEVRDRIAGFRPELVIHAAAATDVDGCEREPEMAYLGNAVATRYVAQAAAAAGAELLYVSTNYVFDGAKPGPYHEYDTPNPVSVYGASKLAGEIEARTATSRCWIVRTAWLYAPEGRNFALTMRRLMQERDHLRVVGDQTGNPTFAPDLGRAIVDIVDSAPYGTYHAANSGVASWYEWAQEIAALTGARIEIEPISGSEYQRAATPPANGAMTSLLLPGLGITLPDWRDALRRCLAP